MSSRVASGTLARASRVNRPVVTRERAREAERRRFLGALRASPRRSRSARFEPWRRGGLGERTAWFGRARVACRTGRHGSSGRVRNCASYASARSQKRPTSVEVLVGVRARDSPPVAHRLRDRARHRGRYRDGDARRARVGRCGDVRGRGRRPRGRGPSRGIWCRGAPHTLRRQGGVGRTRAHHRERGLHDASHRELGDTVPARASRGAEARGETQRGASRAVQSARGRGETPTRTRGRGRGWGWGRRYRCSRDGCRSRGALTRGITTMIWTWSVIAQSHHLATRRRRPAHTRLVSHLSIARGRISRVVIDEILISRQTGTAREENSLEARGTLPRASPSPPAKRPT